MAIFERLGKPPALGDIIERAVLDAKFTMAETTDFHLAKDVAAFANHLGGNILVGYHEQGGVFTKREGLGADELADACTRVSRAVKQRCSPRPVFDFDVLEDDSKRFLAVAVWPTIGTPVGVEVKASKDVDGYGGGAYAFPIRSGNVSTYLLPEQLPMFMSPQIRRVLILLAGMKQGAKVILHGVTRDGGPYPASGVTYDAHEPLTNTLTMMAGQTKRVVPLDCVRSVWHSGSTTDEWHVAISGFFDTGGSFCPM